MVLSARFIISAMVLELWPWRMRLATSSSVVQRRFRKGIGVGALFEFGKALADRHLVGNRLFPVVDLHLGMDKPGDIAQVAAQNLD